jgi:hypothetical protein
MRADRYASLYAQPLTRFSGSLSAPAGIAGMGGLTVCRPRVDFIAFNEWILDT